MHVVNNNIFKQRAQVLPIVLLMCGLLFTFNSKACELSVILPQTANSIKVEVKSGFGGSGNFARYFERVVGAGGAIEYRYLLPLPACRQPTKAAITYRCRGEQSNRTKTVGIGNNQSLGLRRTIDLSRMC